MFDVVQFSGSLTALVTPFRGDAVDFPALDALLERQIAAGTSGLVVCGTTGEAPTLTEEEHRRIVERSVAVVKGRVPVIVGTGSNATAKTIEATRAAQKAGADAALIVTPYYNKPSQDGLYAHYHAVAEAVSLPVILYNVPGRCVVNLEIETVARLARLPNIAGIKDATPDVSRLSRIGELAGPDFALLTGEDALALPALQQGGHGCISVTANVAPNFCAELQTAWRKGDVATAQRLHDRLAPLHAALFTESNPVPVKYALASLGLCAEELRLPLLPATAATRRIVDAALENLFDVIPATAQRRAGIYATDGAAA